MTSAQRQARIGRRVRERHLSLRLLTAIAIAIPVLIAGALSAQAVLARSSCTHSPLVLHVAVSTDIAPAVERVGQEYNNSNRQAAGRCAKVKVTATPPAAVTSQLDGQAPAGSQSPAAASPSGGTSAPASTPSPASSQPPAAASGQQAVDAWIPDSSLWVDAARALPLGAKVVQPTGISVARSPLLLVMPATAAAQVPQFNNSASWNLLLPQAAGGPPSSLGLRVELPDPTQSAAGLSALIEVSRLIGTGTAARSTLSQFVLSVQPSVQFDNPTSLKAFAAQASPPLNARPVTVTSEQAVLGYDAAHPTAPLTAQYPSPAAGQTLAAPELDYPYVMTSTDPAELAAARQFGALLRQPYAAALVRHYGFRSASGLPGALPAGDGLAQQVLQLATQARPAEAVTALQAWKSLQSGSRDLVVFDTSAAMAKPSGLPALSLEQELTQSAQLGLALFPDSTQMGVWQFSSATSHAAPYKALVPIGPLAQGGLISRRTQIEQIIGTLKPQPGPAALDQTILAAYQQQTASYQPGTTNAVVVMTAGLGNAPGDLAVPQLVRDLKALNKPDRPVELIVIRIGTQGNLSAMQRIATAGGGAAFSVTSPAQIGQVFFAGVSRRICLTTGGCPR